MSPELATLPDFLKERYYTLTEIAAAWHISYDAARDQFINETKVLRISHSKKNKRKKTTYRIPESTAKLVYNRLTNGGTHDLR